MKIDNILKHLTFLTVLLFSAHAAAAEDNTSKKKTEEVPAQHVVKLQSTITGDKEQPAISYFIPWQDVGTPDKLQWNMDSKHDDTLSLVDRDVMLRSMQVYKQMNIENPDNNQ